MSRDELWLKLMELGEHAGCHQRADRSFFIAGYQMPLCARCTGVVLGRLISYVMLLSRKRIPLLYALLLLLVMGFDWFIQRIGLLGSTNIRRLITGIIGGIGITFIYAHIICALFKKRGNGL